MAIIRSEVWLSNPFILSKWEILKNETYKIDLEDIFVQKQNFS